MRCCVHFLSFFVKIPIEPIFVNAKRRTDILQSTRNLLVEKPDLKTTAQKAFTSYIRSIILQPNKDVFDAVSINVDDFAQSLGLAKTPTVRLLAQLRKR